MAHKKGDTVEFLQYGTDTQKPVKNKGVITKVRSSGVCVKLSEQLTIFIRYRDIINTPR